MKFHEPRNFLSYEVFLQIDVPMGSLNKLTLVAQLATLGNSGKLRKFKMAAAKIYHGATYPKIMCNTSSIGVLGM